MHWIVTTGFVEDGEHKTENLDGATQHRTLRDARRLAGSYLLTLLAGTGRTGPAQVQAVGRMGWVVTLSDGSTETINVVGVQDTCACGCVEGNYPCELGMMGEGC